MKKIFITLFIIFIISINLFKSDAHAKILLNDKDFWEHNNYIVLEEIENPYGDIEYFIPAGYYMFPGDKNEIEKIMGKWLTLIDEEIDMYLPIIGSKDDNIGLFYTDKRHYFSFSLENDFQDLYYYIENSALDFGYEPNENGDYFTYFYSKEYPTDTGPIFDNPNEIDVYMSEKKKINDIKKMIYAYDYKDGNLSDQINITYENFTGNERIPGKYTVRMTVKDSNNNVTNGEITINLVNDTLPIISSPKTIIVSNSATLDLSFIKQQVIAKDYLGYNLDVIIEDENYTDNKSSIGLYYATFSCIDVDGQKVEATSNINVVNNELEFYSYNETNIVMPRNIKLSNYELINILYSTTSVHIDTASYTIDSRINSTLAGEYYVFYDMLNTDKEIVQSIKLTFTFLNDRDHEEEVKPETDDLIEVPKQESIDFKIFIGPIISIIIVSIVVTSIIVFIKKRQR